MDEAAFQVQLDELHEHQRKLEKQAQTREFLSEINKQLKYFQDLEREERRQADLKVSCNQSDSDVFPPRFKRDLQCCQILRCRYL